LQDDRNELTLVTPVEDKAADNQEEVEAVIFWIWLEGVNDLQA
jgi:hypothetical protein